MQELLQGRMKMGRLFWKFFFFIWLAQLTAIAGISATLWLKHWNDTNAPTPAAGLPAAKPVFEKSPGPRLPPDFETHGKGDGPDKSDKSDKPAKPKGDHGDYAGRIDHAGPGDPGPSAMPSMFKRMPPRDEGLSRTAIPMAVALFASLLFAALMAWYMSKPIRRLSEAFQALAGGKLHTRIGDSMGKREDELAALGRDFDRMAEQLTGSLHSQRRLLHDVSHELRSPLARLQAAIGLARQQPDKAEEYMLRMEREAVRMDKLVGEILTLSRLEAGVQLGQELVHLDELLAELADDARFEAQTAGKVFQVQYTIADLSKIAVFGRYELLHRAIENVLRNAIRHTRPGTTVYLRVEVQGAQLHIDVLDEGNGVPEAELPSIFHPFYRSALAEQSSEGYGLGLAITLRVLQAHGGKIIASNREMSGLCMSMTLPLAFGSGKEGAAILP